VKKEEMNIRTIGVISAVFLLLLVTATLTASAATTVTIQSAEVNVSESTTVPIMINDVTGVKGAHILLEFDSSVVNALDIGNTDFAMASFKEINNSAGYVRYAVFSFTALNGDIKFADVTLEGQSPGTSPLGLTVVSLSDGSAEIPRDVTNGTFTVTGDVPPTIVSYTISNSVIVPPQTTEIDVAFSEEVDYTIAIEKDSTVVYDWPGTATNPDAKVWDGTYEANGTQVPDGDYTVNVTGTSTATGLSVVNNTEIITVTTVDELPPVTTYEVAPAPNAAGWNNVIPVNVTFSRVDQGGSGVNYTRWSTESVEGAWTQVAGEMPFVVPINTEGETTIWYYSVDLNETPNTEAVKNMTVKIDLTDPVIVSVLLDPTTPDPNGDILVTVNVTDALSDVAMVTTNGVALTKQNSPWNGTITAEFLPGTYNVTVIATDNAGNTATDDTAQYTVSEVYGFEFTVDETAKTIVQNETAEYTLTVTNTGNVNDTINLTIMSGPGTLSINPAVDVAVGESKEVTLSVEGINVTDYVTTVNATSQGSEQTASVTVTTTVVAKQYGVTLTPDKTSATITEGQTATYTLTVENTGNTEDTINLTIVSGPGTLSINPEVTLAAAETKDVTLTIKGDAAGIFATTVNATSQGDVNKTASVTVTTTVNKKSVPVGGGSRGPALDTDDDGYSDIVEWLQGSDPDDPCDPDPNSEACLALGATPTPATPTPATPKPTVAVPPPVTTPTTKPPAATPTPTPEEPGFGAVFAIAGLLAVAYLVLRRKQE
jgi:PGF-CTERM protein